MRRLLLALSVVPFLAACGGDGDQEVAGAGPVAGEAVVTSAPAVATSEGTEGGVSAEPTTVEPAEEPEPTTEEPEPVATDQGARAVEVLEQVGYPGSCDDEARTEGELAIAGCAGEELGAVWVLVPPSPSDVDELSVEVMNELFASTCVGDDYVVAAFAVAGAEHVTASGLDCSWP